MSALDQFTAAMTNAGPIGVGLTIAAVPTVAAIAAYIVKVGSQAKIDGMANDAQRLKDQLSDVQAAKQADAARAAERYSELEGRYNAMLQMRAVLQSQLDLITSAVAEIALLLNATDYSVLVPAPTLVPGDRPDEMVFLCASGPQGATLRSVRVPIATSMAGDVFQKGSSSIGSPGGKAASFSRQTDKVSDYHTDETLSTCLIYRGERCGVAQFVNKRTGRFSGADVDRADERKANLATLVGEFVADPSRLADLGYSPRRNDFPATVMFVDLSGYSRLFDILDTSVINDMLNQYFEAMGNIAFAHHAVIDQFIGDGILIVFGGNIPASEQPARAVAAAREMRAAFGRLRDRWTTVQYRGADSLFVRIGLASGPVTRTEIGHRQFRRITVLGASVNHAAAVCERAPRGRDSICVSRPLRDALALNATMVSDEDCGVYEIGL